MIRLFAALAALVVLFVPTPTGAHGDADWVQQGGFRNAAGELCCGERDCFELADGDVKATAAGYYVASTKETIPYNEALPSPDGKYWRCEWGGTRKCFFAPPPNT